VAVTAAGRQYPPSGIGIETARALAGAGAEVTLAVREEDAGSRTAQDIPGNVRVALLDLAERSSVDVFVDSWEGPLHILVDNAGVMASPLTRTVEGWELQFATNHLGHFAVANGLRRALAAAGGARIVSVSSAAHQRSPVVFEDIHFRERGYDPWLAYGQSKTANILFAVEASRRRADDGITANALHPGSIRTNLQRYVDDAELERMRAATGGNAGHPHRRHGLCAGSGGGAATVDGLRGDARPQGRLSATPVARGSGDGPPVRR
jgi:NAD(P)-dependent dehydrogenase (short-subunit alcohol dehydrogenase family)